MKLSTIAAMVAVVVGCSTATPRFSGDSATAELKPTKGNTAKGTVTFVSLGDRVAVTANVSGLTPGNHGFHLHEKGDCNSDDGMSAGGHFNPLMKSHASPSTRERHAGDMPMLEADANGNANLIAELDVIAVGYGLTDVIGKSVIVHKDADDFQTQPTGNSGARVACGIVSKKS